MSVEVGERAVYRLQKYLFVDLQFTNWYEILTHETGRPRDCHLMIVPDQIGNQWRICDSTTSTFELQENDFPANVLNLLIW